jgi:Icc-related predicted phosphoesterase
MRTVRDQVHAFVFGGDTFGLERNHWGALIKGQATKAEIYERTIFSEKSAVEGMPKILDAAGVKPVIMINGNADFLAFEHLRQNKEKFPGLFALKSGEIFKFSGFSFIGIGSIEPDNQDSRGILNLNPWYRGVISSDEQFKISTEVIETTREWTDVERKRAILLTHQPAFGYVDNVSGRKHGTISMFSFVQALNPIVHLTGHVHSVPLKNNIYDFSRAYARMSSGTISINPGGGNVHDSDEGVRMEIIDIEKLIEGCNISDAVKPY